MSVDLADLIEKGGVYSTIDGDTPDEIYKNLTEIMELPESIDKKIVFDALVAREKIMSTAVGNGIALPHARAPIVKDENEQRIAVVYLKKPLDMKAPDNLNVYVMFVLLTQNPQTHLQILSTLVGLFQKVEFRKLLERKASKEELLEAVKQFN